MSASLTETLPDSSGKAGLRLWLKSSGYARRLLLGPEGDPWVAAPKYLAFFTQAQTLLQPDVAVIDVGDLYRSHLRRHSGLAAEMGARKRAVFPLRKLLDEEEPRRLLAEVVEAALAHLRGRQPLVLAMPSPRAWLAEAAATAGLSAVAADEEADEDAAMYMADLLRSLSSQAIGGVLFEEPDGREIAAGALACYRPLLNIAAHYRWGAALRARFASGLDGKALEGFDATISDRPMPAGTRAAGINVSAQLWGDETIPDLAPGQFRWVAIPVEARPEAVLERLATLR
jgi:hypothetical protein